MEIDIQDITIQDLLAVVVVIGGMGLVAKGIDGTVGTVLVMVVTFYFSRVRHDKTRQ